MNTLQEKINALYQYLPPLTKEPDFDEFWEQTLAETKDNPTEPIFTPVESFSPYLKVYEVTYYGFDATEIYGWYLRPLFVEKETLPCVISYHGFTGDRGQPHQLAHWPLAGLAVLSVDCRMQGGMTGNTAAYQGGQVGSVITLGLLNKEDYYYRAVYMDALKAIDVAESRPEVDKNAIILEGTSQGGGLVMAVAALDDRPALALPQVASYSNITQRVYAGAGSYGDVKRYLRRYPHQTAQALSTLSYFDTMNLADRVTCPVFASVGLEDDVCPPMDYFATYNRLLGEKEIEVYPFNLHDGARHVHVNRQFQYLKGKGIIGE